MRVFKELTPECDKTAQLFAQGYEKKEIAEIKCRSFYTINNQINTAFELLNVRNGRELTIKYAERLTGKSIIDLSERARKTLSVFLLCVFFVGMADHTTQDRRLRRMRVETELLVRRNN